MNQSAAEKKTYTLNEFLAHFKALTVIREYQHISRDFANGEQVEIGTDQSLGANALRLIDYFHQVYSDREEAMDKCVLFFRMVTHLVRFREAYDSERFAVFSGRESEPSMISTALLRAVHHHFTLMKGDNLSPEESLVEVIKATARGILKEEEEVAHGPKLPPK